MNAKKFTIGKIIMLSLCPSFLIFGYSCIDKKYDLTKDISTIVGIGGELGFPQRFIKTGRYRRFNYR